MDRCKYGKQYLAEERIRMLEAIETERARLSRKAGRDVGVERAKTVFLRKHLAHFAKEFRREFCNDICRARATCRVKF
jgi:hypothetical protein